ncbi:hypothetical protein [Paenibacillus sp. LC231]|uniref:hypothetical protein n=1 Tax=Paenibacillus sp. LC231 TaxID=1120679 RepID=UPI001F2CAD75|nr:hypothetical protein [Paenibacillus sp. LC231]
MGGSESSFRMLKILDRFQGIISRMGVDYATLRRILHVKLLMDSRRAPVILSSSNRKKEEEQDKNLFVSSLWLYGLIGLVLTPFVFWSDPEYLMPMSILSAILMFLIMSSMISDFSSVLLDVRDRSILMTKPIDGRTVGLARSIHAGIYLLLLTGALSRLTGRRIDQAWRAVLSDLYPGVNSDEYAHSGEHFLGLSVAA